MTDLEYITLSQSFTAGFLSQSCNKQEDGIREGFWAVQLEHSLYNIVRDPHATVSKVMATSPLNISFRRALVDKKLADWLSLVARISNVELVEGSDYFRWGLTDSGLFSVRSMYLYLIDTQIPFRHKKI